MTDARLVLWVRWRQVKGTVLYWLRLTGFKPEVKGAGERVYLVYLLAAVGLWAGLMWAYAAYQANALGHALPPRVIEAALLLLPWPLFAAAIWLLFTALRSCPIRLTAEDMTYLAASPLPRSVPVLLGLAASVAFVVGLATPLALLGALVVAGALGTDQQAAMTQAAVAGILLAVLLRTLAWLGGLLGLGALGAFRRAALWSVPLVLMVVAWLAPGVALWPALVLAAALAGAAGPATLGGLGALTTLTLVGAGVASSRANMVAMAEASAPFGRAQGFGLRLPSPSSLWRPRGRRRGPAAPFPSLPGGLGLGAVAARAALTSLRRPWRTLGASLQAAGIAVGGAWVIAQHSPLEVWSVWLLLAVVRPPRGLLGALWTDWDEPFLRQFLPYGSLTLFVADVAAPGLVAALAVILAWGLVAMPAGFDLISGAVAVAILALLTLCQAAGRIRLPVLNLRVRYPVLSGSCLGLLVVLGVYLGSSLAALVGACACCGLLAQALADGDIAED